MPTQTFGRILKNQRIKSNYFLLEIRCPSIANQVRPGQFVMLKASSENYPLLRRPFSVYKSYSTQHPSPNKRGSLLILYKKVGLGTRRMTFLKKGDRINLIGPVGNNFTLPPLPSSEKFILIGGGVGIASLVALNEAIGPGEKYIFIGGKTENDILCEKDFQKNKHTKIFIATEDGSKGEKGMVTDLFFSQITRFNKNEVLNVYACGPTGMLKTLSKKVSFRKWILQASLEAIMGCGIGACWGCVVKTTNSQAPYQRVCKEGPVFLLNEIIWE